MLLCHRKFANHFSRRKNVKMSCFIEVMVEIPINKSFNNVVYHPIYGGLIEVRIEKRWHFIRQQQPKTGLI